MTARVLGRGLSRTLHVALGLAAPILLVALVYAPFSEWGPFAGPSPLDGCPAVGAAAFAGAALGDWALTVAAWAAGVLVLVGVGYLLLGAALVAREPRNQDYVGGLRRAGRAMVALGWVLALWLRLAPC